MRYPMFKKAGIAISKYFFLLLFIGFLGSITLFNHAHIVNGVTIVHSHPFKSDSNGKPLHSHSENGFITIHFLSVILISSILCYLSVQPFRHVSHKIINIITKRFVEQTFLRSYSLRAPPAKMFS